MQIKTTLKQLIGFFAQSASELKDESVRRLAARLTVLTAHVERVDQKIDSRFGELDAHIAEVVAHLIEQRNSAPVATPSNPSAPPAVVEETPPQMSEEDQEADDLVAKINAETQAELASLEKEAPVALVPRKVNGKKAQQGGAP